MRTIGVVYVTVHFTFHNLHIACLDLPVIVFNDPLYSFVAVLHGKRKYLRYLFTNCDFGRNLFAVNHNFTMRNSFNDTHINVVRYCSDKYSPRQSRYFGSKNSSVQLSKHRIRFVIAVDSHKLPFMRQFKFRFHN